MFLSRRKVVAVAAATVTIPMLDAAVGAMRSAAAAAAASKPAVTEEAAGWFKTAVKAAELKDNEFVAVAGHAIVLARADKTVAALSSKCTHKGCTINPKAGSKVLTCSCHNAQFNLDGNVAKGPATVALGHYAIRVNAEGLVEIDPGQKLAKDEKGATISLG